MISRPERTHFFQNQLKEEEPLTLATASRLYTLSAVIMGIAPWEFLADQNLFVLQDGNSGEMCYCSVMGAMGEVFSLYVYVGSESYRFFKKVSLGEPVSSSDFLGSQTGVSVEFVKASELTPPDRDLLKYFDHPTKRGLRSPIFRALRPGYYSWYVTESEGSLLAECMQALIAFCEHLSRQTVNFWEEEDRYPLLTPSGAPERGRYQIQTIKAPMPAAPPPKPPVMDETRLRRLRERDYTVRGCLEADSFSSNVKIGGPNERRSFVRVGLVTDATSGFLFPPELGTASKTAGEVLVNAILNAIETANCIPAEVRVSSQEMKVMLEPLVQQIGTALRVVKSLPSLREAKEGLLATMGDPGMFQP